MTIDEAFDILRSLPKEWGSSEEEVSEVESGLGARLPEPLRELTLRTGRGTHMRWLFPDRGVPPLAGLLDLQEVALSLLQEEPALRPTFPFVTLSEHQGYEFSFVRAGHSSDDAEVLFYQENHGFGRSGTSLRLIIASAVRRALARG